MAREQRRHRLVVRDPPPVPGDRIDPILVRHADPRVVADLPSRVVQTPDEIDVLAELEVLVKAAAERLTPRDHRRARHVPDPAVRAHQRWVRAHVERRMTSLVRGDPACPSRTRRSAARPGPRPGRRGGRAARRESRRAGRSRRRGTRPSASLPTRARYCGRRPPRVLGVADVASAETVGDCGDRAAVGRAIVDHDHAAARRRAAPDSAEPLGVTIDRHDDRHLVGGRRRCGWAAGRGGGRNQAGVEQTASEQTLGVPDRLARPASARQAPRRAPTASSVAAANPRAAPRRPAPPQPSGRPQAPPGRDGHPVGTVSGQSAVDREHRAGQRGCRGPHSHTAAAATSAGSIRRRISC